MWGFEYEKKDLYDGFMVENIGDVLTEFGLFLPLNFFEQYKPTHPITWVAHGVVMYTVMVIWMFSFGILLAASGLFLSEAIQSWQEMQRRRKFRGQSDAKGDNQ